MTGFSADWLALREGADRRARSASLRDEVAGFLAKRPKPTIVDLACGTGSNLRALAPFLNARQSWRLVDCDPALLDAARATLIAWAEAYTSGPALCVRYGSCAIDVAFEGRDLRSLDPNLFSPDVDLVAAAAFFDLVSAAWIESFCDVLLARRLPLYAVLTYAGAERWSPPHPADPEMLAAFHAHQGRDKGFGPAAGPNAGALLALALRERGYRVSLAASPWRLGVADALLIRELAHGSAGAALETGQVCESVAEDWRRRRVAAASCEVDHVDLFATPPNCAPRD